MSEEKTGTCLCGAVKVKTNAPCDKFGACHCAMCRKWGGGPYLEVECGTDVHLEGEENITVYPSSEWAERGFCKTCGTHLFYRLKQAGLYHVPLGLFGDQINPEFEKQVFIDKKPGNYTFREKTDEYTQQQIFEMFGSD